MTSPPTLRDIEVLARTLWGEARGEGIVGMQAVASVILNRARDERRWPDIIRAVCRQPYQFSCWLKGDPNRAKLEAVGLEDRRYRECYAVAAMAVAGMIEDRTEGATHYLNEGALSELPDWAEPKRLTVRLGHHTFYRL